MYVLVWLMSALEGSAVGIVSSKMVKPFINKESIWWDFDLPKKCYKCGETYTGVHTNCKGRMVG